MSASAKLAMKEVSKQYPSHNSEPFYAVKNCSLIILDQQFVTLLGPSGCGKTTLLKIAAGLSQPSEGEVLLNGDPVKGPSPKCGYLPQAYPLFPWLTVERNIEFGLTLTSKPHPERAEIVERLVELIGLGPYRRFYPKALSGGMQQRVAIARTLAVDPEILLLDEPFGALDTQTRIGMQEHLLAIWAKMAKTVFFVTHDVEEAIFLSDVIYVSSPRPGTIRSRIEVTFERPRDHALREQVEFLEAKRDVMNVMRLHHSRDLAIEK